MEEAEARPVAEVIDDVEDDWRAAAVEVLAPVHERVRREGVPGEVGLRRVGVHDAGFGRAVGGGENRGRLADADGREVRVRDS